MLIILVMWNQIVSSFGNRFKSIQKFVKSCYHQAVLEEMLSKNDDTDFNKVDQAGWYPIHRAIVLANIEILKNLLERGANPSLKINGYLSPLCKAILYEKEEIGTYLLSLDLDISNVSLYFHFRNKINQSSIFKERTFPKSNQLRRPKEKVDSGFILPKQFENSHYEAFTNVESGWKFYQEWIQISPEICGPEFPSICT